MNNQERAVPRTPADGLIRAEVTVYQAVRVLDISEKGAQIDSPVPLLIDSLHDFRLELDDRPVVVKGRVAYCYVGNVANQGVQYRCGVEFVEPAPHAVSTIREFIAIHPLTPPPILDAEIEEG